MVYSVSWNCIEYLVFIRVSCSNDMSGCLSSSIFVAVEASDVPGDDVEISPELSFAFTGVCCFVGFGFVWAVVLADSNTLS